MDIEPGKPVVNGRMWQLGQSGNPNGRPVGSRTVFSVVRALHRGEAWHQAESSPRSRASL